MLYLLFFLKSCILVALHLNDQIGLSSHLVDTLTNLEAHAQLSFINSTSGIISLTIYHENPPVSYVSRCSAITLTLCTLTLFFETHPFPFLNHGQLILDKLSITQNALIHSLIKCYEVEDLSAYNSFIWSNVEIRSSSFGNRGWIEWVW